MVPRAAATYGRQLKIHLNLHFKQNGCRDSCLINFINLNRVSRQSTTLFNIPGLRKFDTNEFFAHVYLHSTKWSFNPIKTEV